MNALKSTTTNDTLINEVSTPAITIASIQSVVKEWLSIKGLAENATDKAKGVTNQVAFVIFTALSEGLDLEPLKAMYSKEVWSSVKRPFSKANTLYSYLAAGNYLEISNDIDGDVIVSIETVLDKVVTLSTAHTAMTKRKKELADQDRAMVEGVTTSIEAYLRSDQVNKDHKGIPSDALVTRLALQGSLNEVRTIGDSVLKAESEAIDKDNKAQALKDAIALVKSSGYEVKASKPNKK